uniref:Guanine nucleotide-binding protein subunit beta-like protein n=1 Tax=Chrysotila carterae TaxID=13221 RepID=A0A7S4ET24_CHRCT|mmetsp:Transcript_53647/g.116969  ORF Transcript_53647/g.116969 Transcript_53647/m.116969 type:complete len:346 (+) Transcript_53647:242-1279(+)
MPTLSSVFAPLGDHLLTANSRGKLQIWQVPQPDNFLGTPPALIASRQIHNCPVYCLIFITANSQLLLVSASDEDICIWSWEALLMEGTGKGPLARLQSPQHAHRRGGLGPLAETTSIAFDPSSATLYSGSGNGNAYAWDLSNHKCVTTYSGHTDMIHCLGLRRRHGQLVTGSEDSTMRLWDVRSAVCAHVLSPSLPPMTSQSAARAAPDAPVRESAPSLWCGCLALDEAENWLAAGWGAGFISTVEMRSLACVGCLPTSAPPQAVAFLPHSDARLVSIGAEKSVYTWKVTGELETRAACSSPSAFALAARAGADGDVTVAVGGFAPAVDIFYDMSHKAVSLPIVV